MWVLLLFSGTAALILAPLVPALREWYLKSDVQPLGIDQDHMGRVRHFADVFESHIGGFRSAALSKGHRASVVRAVAPDNGSRSIMVTESSCMLPDNARYEREILANNALGTGVGSRFVGVLAKSHLVFRRNSVLLRWAHGKSVGIEDGCLLLGRITADDKIVVRRESRFTRLNAPCIVFGDAGAVADLALTFATPKDWLPDGLAVESQDRVLHNGDADMAAQSTTAADLIVRGNLRIGRGATVVGSVKSHGDLVVEASGTITGSVICRGRLTIGEGCRLGGPVVSEQGIEIAADVIVGTHGHRATVTAPEIRVVEGSVVCGTVWAGFQGWVVTRETCS